MKWQDMEEVQEYRRKNETDSKILSDNSERGVFDSFHVGADRTGRFFAVCLHPYRRFSNFGYPVVNTLPPP